MKNIMCLLVLCFSTTLLSAQNNVVDLYFSSYENDSQFSKLNVNEKTFTLFTEIETKDAAEADLISSIKKLEGIKGLFKEHAKDAVDIFSNAQAKIVQTRLMRNWLLSGISEHKGIFMIRESEEGIIQELIVMGATPNEFGVITIFGEIDLHRIKDLATVIEKNGKAWFEIFENVSDDVIVFGSETGDQRKPKASKSSIADGWNLQVYPNPATDHVIIKNLNASKGNYSISFLSLMGERIKEEPNISFPYRLELRDVPTGSYFIRITDSNGKFKNFKVVKP